MRPPSKPFWYGTLSIWSLYAIFYAASVSLHRVNFFEQLTHSAIIGGLGILFSLLYRCSTHAFSWHNQNPIKLIPFSMLLAILCGYLFTLIDYWALRGASLHDIVIGVIKTPKEYWWSTFAMSQWISTSLALLAWLLLFNFIQAERYDKQVQKPTRLAVFTAAVSLVLFMALIKILQVVGLHQSIDSIFNLYFVVNHIVAITTGVGFGFLIYLFRSERAVLGSYVLPLAPGIIFIIFSTSFFCMLTQRLITSIECLVHSNLMDLPKNIASIFAEPNRLWLNRDAFIGTLRSQIDLQTVIILLLMHFRYPFGHMAKQVSSNQFNVKITLEFWLYNSCGWSMLAGYLYFSDLLNWQSVSNEFARTMFATLIIGGVFSGLLMRSLIRRFALLDKTLAAFSVSTLLISLIFGLLLAGCLWLTGYISVYSNDTGHLLQRYEALVKHGDFFIPLIVSASAGCWIWIMIYEKTVSKRIKEKKLVTQLQIEKNLKDLQLNQLAGKIDPHFIFNALNNIRSLIREDTDKAREAILVLSNILRTPLASNANKICLQDEINLVNNYIHLCKIQMEERLIYSEFIAPGINQALIPPMCLQILAENAIKHGISQLPDGGELTLSVTSNQGQLICTLTNSGHLTTAGTQPGFGVGLHSIRERLQLLYGEHASLSLHEQDQRVTATITLPLEYAP